MKRSTRLFTILLALVMIISLAGCGGSSSQSGTQSTGSTGSASTGNTEKSTEPLVFKLASSKSSTSAQAPCLDWFADEVAKRTNGEIEIRVYHDATLGNQDEIAEGLRMGTIEMAYSNNGAWGKIVPDYNILTPMFAFNENQMLDFLESDTVKELYDQIYEEYDVYMRGAILDGTRNIWTSKKVEKISDFNGIKLRVPDVTVLINSFSALGFNTVVIPFGDVYTALQTGVAGGLEMDDMNIASASLDEVCKYCLKTGHMNSFFTMAMTRETREKLTDEQREIIDQCIDEACALGTQLYREYMEDVTKHFEEAGVTITDMSSEELAKMRELTAPINEETFKNANVQQKYIDGLNAFISTLN